VLAPLPPDEEIHEALHSTTLRGAAHLAKFVGVARTEADALRVHAAAAGAKIAIPHIALAMGAAGRMSRVLNSLFTPVTHAALPFAAAPGQLSVEDILAARRPLGYLPVCHNTCLPSMPTLRLRAVETPSNRRLLTMPTSARAAGARLLHLRLADAALALARHPQRRLPGQRRCAQVRSV
jgi:hypothetical protein